MGPDRSRSGTLRKLKRRTVMLEKARSGGSADGEDF
jgi:hypothetical protein